MGRVVGHAGASLFSASPSLASEAGGQEKPQVHVPFASRPHVSVPELPSAQCEGGGLPHSLFSHVALVESELLESPLAESAAPESGALVVVSLLLQAVRRAERSRAESAFIARGYPISAPRYFCSVCCFGSMLLRPPSALSGVRPGPSGSLCRSFSSSSPIMSSTTATDMPAASVSLSFTRPHDASRVGLAFAEAGGHGEHQCTDEAWGEEVCGEEGDARIDCARGGPALSHAVESDVDAHREAEPQDGHQATRGDDLGSQEADGDAEDGGACADHASSRRRLATRPSAIVAGTCDAPDWSDGSSGASSGAADARAARA